MLHSTDETGDKDFEICLLPIYVNALKAVFAHEILQTGDESSSAGLRIGEVAPKEKRQIQIAKQKYL